MHSLYQYLVKLWGKSGWLPGYRYAVIERFAARLSPDNLFDAVLPNGLIVACDLRDHVQRHIYHWGVYEPVESWIFTQLIKPGHIVIDAGANVGQYSMLASTIVKPDGMVHAFEPAKTNRLKMAINLVRNRIGNVRLNDLALWDQPEELTMSLDQADQTEINFGGYSVSKKPVIEELVTGLSNSVAGIRLDDYVREQGLSTVDVIKMDIEGSEARALNGSRDTLLKNRPIILMELNQQAARSQGGELVDLWRLLVDDLKYDLYPIEPSLKPPLKLNSLDGIARMNVVAVPKEAPMPAVLESPIHLKPILAWARTVRRMAGDSVIPFSAKVGYPLSNETDRIRLRTHLKDRQ